MTCCDLEGIRCEVEENKNIPESKSAGFIE
jgi:hypothetical protein